MINMQIFSNNIQVYTGDELREQIHVTKKYVQRNNIVKIFEYLKSRTPRLLLISGLRRTGKTIMIKQAIDNLSDDQFKKTSLINIDFVKEDIDYFDLEHIVELLYREEISYIFIDVASSIRDLCINSKRLCDNYCFGDKRIILIESNSISFWLAKRYALFGRFE